MTSLITVPSALLKVFGKLVFIWQQLQKQLVQGERVSEDMNINVS